MPAHNQDFGFGSGLVKVEEHRSFGHDLKGQFWELPPPLQPTIYLVPLCSSSI